MCAHITHPHSCQRHWTITNFLSDSGHFIMYGIGPHVTVWVYESPLLCMMFSRSIHVVTWVNTSFPFKTSSVCGRCHLLCIHHLMGTWDVSIVIVTLMWASTYALVCVFLCVCVYECVCTCLSVYGCVCVCRMCVYMFICICVYIWMCVLMCVYMFACVCVCMFVYECVYMCECAEAEWRLWIPWLWSYR